MSYLLTAKHNPYGFEKNTLDLVYSYLKNRKQRVKVNTTFSTWTDLISGMLWCTTGISTRSSTF